MKNWVPPAFLLMMLLISNCTPPIVFNQPQPIEGETVYEIPKDYQGLFICESDSTLIIISDFIVYAQHEHYFIISIEGLEEREDCSLLENEIYLPGKELCIPVEYIDEETVKGYITDIDTLFIMDGNHVAKTYKGHLFLSNKIGKVEWAVSMLNHDEQENLIYRGITEDSDFKKINKITPLEEITRPRDKKRRFRITPDPAAFEKLFKAPDVFIECEYLIRVNLEVNQPDAF